MIWGFWYVILGNVWRVCSVWLEFHPFFVQQHIINPVRKALDYYTEMEKALEREKQNRAQSDIPVKNKETAVGAQSPADSHTDTGPEASKPDAH